MLGLKPIKMLPARERVAAALRKAIISRQITEGEVLTLESTAQELGVSITPVREAFQILERDGLIDLLSELWSGLSMGVKMTEAEYAKKSLKEHEGIVESMKKCDTMEAAMKMHQHIERSLEDVLTEFEK